MTEELLVSRAEAARRLSICVRLVDYAIEKGRLRVRRVGRRVLIPITALAHFAQQDQPVLSPAQKKSPHDAAKR